MEDEKRSAPEGGASTSANPPAKTPANADEDESDSFVDELDEIDDERTLDEDEAVEEEDSNELENLEAENELSVEELMQKYYGGAEVAAGSSSQPPVEQQPSASSGAATTDPTPTVSAAGNGAAAASAHGYFSDSTGSEDDDDYQPPEVWKKVIHVGENYQASLPSLSPASIDYNAERVNAQLETPLWKSPPAQLSKVEAFLSELYSDRPPLKKPAPGVPAQAVPDDEDALYLLLTNDLNLGKATEQYRELRRKQSRLRLKTEEQPPAAAAIVAHSSQPTWAPQVDIRVAHGWPEYKCWSEHEIDLFEHGLKEYGKDFTRIQRDFFVVLQLLGRSVRDLVYFYYIWKKTERHDMFVERCRLEKRQYVMHPYVSDYTEHFLDEVEALASSVRSGSHTHNQPSQQSQQQNQTSGGSHPSPSPTTNTNNGNGNGSQYHLIASDKNRLLLDENAHSTHYNQMHSQRPTASSTTAETAETEAGRNGAAAAAQPLPLIDSSTLENVLKE